MPASHVQAAAATTASVHGPMSFRPAARRPGRIGRVTISLSVAGYVLAYPWLFSYLGNSAGTLVILSVFFVAWSCGWLPGLLGGLATFPVNLALTLTVSDQSAGEWIARGALLGTCAVMSLGFLVGWLNHLNRRARSELEARERIERGLQESELRFRTLAEASPAMITLFEGSTRTLVNATATRMTGYSREALLTGGIEIAVHPDDRHRVRERWASRDRGETPTSPFAFRILTTEGETRWLEAYSSPIDDTRLVSVAVDVTDRKQAEAAARASDRRFRTIFDESPTGMALLDLDQRFSAVNQALCDMLGYDADTLVTLRMPEVTHPDDVGLDADLVGQVLAGGLASYRIEKRWRQRDGDVLHVSLTLSIVMDRDGRPLHGIAMVEDVSQQRRMRDSMMQAQRLESVGLLAGGIAHNFNNALTAVSGYSAGIRRPTNRRRGAQEDPGCGRPIRQPHPSASRVRPTAGNTARTLRPERRHPNGTAALRAPGRE